MGRLIILLPFILFVAGYNTGIIFTRIAAAIAAVISIILYPSHITAVSILASLCLAEFFIEKFNRRTDLTRKNFNDKLAVLVNELALAKKESETTKLNLTRSEKSIKNILHIYELVKDIASCVEFEKMFPLITQSLDEQFLIKNAAMKIFEGNKSFQKGTLKFIDETVESPKIADGIIHLPLAPTEKIVGVISAKIPPLFEKDREFPDEISAFVEEINPAIQRAILYMKIESLSRTDGLTGLYRRGYFNGRLKEEELRAKRVGGKFSIMMMDIDHFKNINDTYGHQAGDAVLRTVAGILKENIYETDFAARYGGEEFVVIFPQTEAAGIKIKAEKIRQKIQEAEIAVELEKVKVTASFGIAHYPKDGLTSEEVLKKSDVALYKSKETGRNKVTEFAE